MLSELAQGASRLVQTLEKLGEWAGNGVGGNGPSGPPSDDVVRVFEQAMTGEPAGSDMPVPGDAAAENAFASPDPGPAESVPSLDRIGGSGPEQEGGFSGTEAFRPEFGDEHPVRELGRLLDAFSRPGATLGPEALFRAQYLTGMLKVQAQAGLRTSQSASVGMESVLRQQG